MKDDRMDAPHNTEESMEDILASIRQILSSDTLAPAKPPKTTSVSSPESGFSPLPSPAALGEESLEEDPEKDVLVLTKKVAPKIPSVKAFEPQKSSQSLHSGLEGLVRSSLTPLLKEWLDTNLPPLVEKVVREEIQSLLFPKK